MFKIFHNDEEYLIEGTKLKAFKGNSMYPPEPAEFLVTDITDKDGHLVDDDLFDEIAEEEKDQINEKASDF